MEGLGREQTLKHTKQKFKLKNPIIWEMEREKMTWAVRRNTKHSGTQCGRERAAESLGERNAEQNAKPHDKQQKGYQIIRVSILTPVDGAGYVVLKKHQAKPASRQMSIQYQAPAVFGFIFVN